MLIFIWSDNFSIFITCKLFPYLFFGPVSLFLSLLLKLRGPVDQGQLQHGTTQSNQSENHHMHLNQFNQVYHNQSEQVRI